MKNFFKKIRRFFSPGADASRWAKAAPYLVLIVIFVLTVIMGTYTWEYTNSSEFCGSACHGVHPSEIISYQISPHAEVKCVECHIGREFVGNQFTRKLGDIRHVIAHVSKNYEYPLHVKTLRPAREVCEQCHNPDKFSDDSQRSLFHYSPDEENTLFRTYLVLKTGGGSIREGLGRGIHWHTQNTVYFYATNESEQEIPFVRVVDSEGSKFDYVDIASNFNAYDVDEAELVEMDCITCHNRITHFVPQPEEAVDTAMFKGLISPEIPNIRKQAVEILRGEYDANEKAINAISSLDAYYRDEYPEFYEGNYETLNTAISTLKDIYNSSVFPEQKMDWDTHLDNLGHLNDPGCFRCHDGKHLSTSGDSIRLDCSLCHALPVTSGPEDMVTHLDINHAPQPTTHQNPNWIILHKYDFNPDDPDMTCISCHDITNYDGPADDSSFCSNSACHGRAWASVDLEVLQTEEMLSRLILQLPHLPMGMEPYAAWGEDEDLFHLDEIHRVQEGLVCADCHDPFPPTQPAPNAACIACHGETDEGLIALTARFNPNPHDWHYGEGTPCYVCHGNFGPYKEPCALCHENLPYEEIQDGTTTGN